MDSSTLWEQTWFLSRHLPPTYEANHADVLEWEVIAVDETWWRLMRKGSSKRWWLVPEPETALLLGMGFAGLGVARRLRR